MGSSGRKRAAEQMAADGGLGDETPTRSDKKTKSGRKKKDKKRGNKNKDQKSGNKSSNKSGGNKDGSSSTGTSMDTTATAEGKQMAQVLSTFSRLEQSRFEAFRKAAFPGDAISRYVAHCLIHDQHRPLSNGCSAGISPSSHPTSGAQAAATSGADPETATKPRSHRSKDLARFRHLRPTAHFRRRPVLSEVVAPGQSGDITVVVSTLAKEYAQRLVLVARRYATERTNRARKKRERWLHGGGGDDDDGSSSEEGDEDIAISPDDLLKAHADREARGLDPGFFLQGTANQKNISAAQTALFLNDPETTRRYSQLRSVALAAQEEYDKDRKKEAEEEAKNAKENENDKKDSDGDDMDIDDALDAEMEDSEDSDAASKDGEESVATEVEQERDVSEEAVKMYSLHVQWMIARQHGIPVVTSDDEDASKKTAEKDENEATANPSQPTGQQDGASQQPPTTLSAQQHGSGEGHHNSSNLAPMMEAVAAGTNALAPTRPDITTVPAPFASAASTAAASTTRQLPTQPAATITIANAGMGGIEGQQHYNHQQSFATQYTTPAPAGTSFFPGTQSTAVAAPAPSSIPPSAEVIEIDD